MSRWLLRLIEECLCFTRVFAFRAGGSQEASTSISDLDIEPGSETECRDRGLGGTMEDNTEECFLETPMMSAASRTADSFCPLWLRKVFAKAVAPSTLTLMAAVCCGAANMPQTAFLFMEAAVQTGTGGRRIHPDAPRHRPAHPGPTAVRLQQHHSALRRAERPQSRRGRSQRDGPFGKHWFKNVGFKKSSSTYVKRTDNVCSLQRPSG